jgi:RNA polymerase-binding transcription factor DksA
VLDDSSGERLREERTETARRIVSLNAELDGIIESAQLSNNDDEHDPDGATAGYERAKATALLQQARLRLAEIDRAMKRTTDGSYGRCDHCGSAIGEERLDAIPTTTRCTACASLLPDG